MTCVHVLVSSESAKELALLLVGIVLVFVSFGKFHNSKVVLVFFLFFFLDKLLPFWYRNTCIKPRFFIAPASLLAFLFLACDFPPPTSLESILATGH